DNDIRVFEGAADAVEQSMTRDAPELVCIVPDVAIMRDAGRRHGRKRAIVLLDIIVERAIRAEQNIIVQGLNDRKAGSSRRFYDPWRQGFAPTVNMNNRLLGIQPSQQSR